MRVEQFLLEGAKSGMLRMPRGALVLHVEATIGAIALHALVDPKQKPVERWFYVVKTGKDIVRSSWDAESLAALGPASDPRLTGYLGSCDTMQGKLHVFHVTSNPEA
jgi:hypothetical protein